MGSTFTRNINLEQPHFQGSTAHVATGYHIRLSRLKEMFFKLWVTIYNGLRCHDQWLMNKIFFFKIFKNVIEYSKIENTVYQTEYVKLMNLEIFISLLCSRNFGYVLLPLFWLYLYYSNIWVLAGHTPSHWKLLFPGLLFGGWVWYMAKFWQLECECKCSVQLSGHDLEGLGSVLPFSSLLLSGIWCVDGSQIFHCRE